MESNSSLGKKSSKTRKKIIDTCLACMKGQRFDRISVKELTARADISRNTFYLYFDSIYTLIEELENELLSEIDALDKTSADEDWPKYYETELKESLDGLPLTIVTPFTLALVHYFEFHQDVLLPLLGPNGDPYFESKLLKILKKHFYAQLLSEHLPDHPITLYIAEILAYVHVFTISRWITEPKESRFSLKYLAIMVNYIKVGGTACYRKYD